MKLDLVVQNIIQETNDTLTLEFATKENVIYNPGQFLNLEFNYNNEKIKRAYSLSSSPDIDKNLSVTVKRVKGGKISNYINENLKVGDKLISDYPKGKFTPLLDPSFERNVVLIGAGSGITPLMSIAKSVLYKEKKSKLYLFYGSRYEDSIIFYKAFRELEKKFQNRFKIFYFVSQPTMLWNGYTGRIQKENLEFILKSNQILDEKNDYFLCGPSEMMEDSITTLADLGTNIKNINFESFGNKKFANFIKTLTREQKPKLEKSVVKIKYEGDEYILNVDNNQTILEAALDREIDIPFACNSGTCNVCQARCIKGKVKMDIDDGLTQEEIDDNYILTCVSRPLTSSTEIEIE